MSKRGYDPHGDLAEERGIGRSRMTARHCAWCRRDFLRDRYVRKCGFHPATGVFVPWNKSCGLLMRLKWIVYRQGVEAWAREDERGYACWSVGYWDVEGGKEVPKRFQMVWLKASGMVTIAQLLVDSEVRLLTLEDGEKLLQQFGVDEQGLMDVSVGFTR